MSGANNKTSPFNPCSINAGLWNGIVGADFPHLTNAIGVMGAGKACFNIWIDEILDFLPHISLLICPSLMPSE